MKTKEERADVYQRITEQIIKAIEQGAEKWQMPWHRSQTIPVNAATGKPYSGVNVLTLWAIAAQQNYRSGIWATYAQWLELGAQVRKGEKSAFIVFWKFRDQAADVFNADQVDGFILPDLPTLPPTQRIESADRFFASLNADLRHGGSRAFYSPTGDFIQLLESSERSKKQMLTTQPLLMSRSIGRPPHIDCTVT